MATRASTHPPAALCEPDNAARGTGKRRHGNQTTCDAAIHPALGGDRTPRAQPTPIGAQDEADGVAWLCLAKPRGVRSEGRGIALGHISV